MGDLTDIINVVEARMEALGFNVTEEVFDFDNVPDSVIHKSFRIVRSPIENNYLIGNIANTKDAIEIWIAYKMRRKARTAYKAALDDMETIEKDIINASSIRNLSSDPLLEKYPDSEVPKYLEDYLVSKLVFTADYIRDISSS